MNSAALPGQCGTQTVYTHFAGNVGQVGSMIVEKAARNCLVGLNREIALMSAHDSEHLSDQKLLAYGLGWVDDSISSVVDHLEHCEDCRRRVVEGAGDRFIHYLRQAALQQTNRSAEKSREP